VADIYFISPYIEVSIMAKNVAKELGLDMEIIESGLEEAVEIVRPHVEANENVILVSRGATANLIEKAFPNVLLLRVESNEFDIMQGLNQAKHIGKRAGMLTYKPNETDFKKQLNHLTEMLSMEVSYYFYEDSIDFISQIERAKFDRIEILIGGGMRAQKISEKIGIEHISVLPGLSTIQQALTRVSDIIKIRAEEQKTSQLIRTVVDCSHDGIIAINEKKRVVVYNPKAEKLLNLPPTEVMNRSLSELGKYESLLQLFRGPVNQLEEVKEIAGVKVWVNRAPFIAGNDQNGVIVTFREITQIQESEQRIRRELYSKGLMAKYTFSDIIYTSKNMQNLIQKAQKYAHIDSNVLIIGESGTGKELMAQSLHNAHPARKKGPFVAVNCTALADHLLESELFGYEAGAFTGANKNGKPGLFELAHGGTIFLDEIGKVSIELQDKLLRVIQEQEIRRIGGQRNIPIDVRIIAAVNNNIHKQIENGEFRLDLYYRLEILVIKLPPLRERKEDIPDLAKYMVSKYANKYKKQFEYVPGAIFQQLSVYDWPGNLRQLENIIERSIVMSEDPNELQTMLTQILQEEFGRSLSEVPTKQLSTNISFQQDEQIESSPDTLKVPIGTIEDMQRHLVQQLIAKRPYTKTELAQTLGVSRTTLWKLLKDVSNC